MLRRVEALEERLDGIEEKLEERLDGFEEKLIMCFDEISHFKRAEGPCASSLTESQPLEEPVQHRSPRLSEKVPYIASSSASRKKDFQII